MKRENRELTQLDRIERYALLAAKNVLTVDDVVILTSLSASTIYKMTCTQQIPFYKPNGKSIFFDKKEIEDWLRRNRVATVEETEERAANFNLRNS